MIYATPFKASTLERTGPSTDSGFESLVDAIAAMGETSCVRCSSRMAIYGSNDDHVVFSDFAFYVDSDPEAS